MAKNRDEAGRWLGRVAAALVLAPALGLSTRAEAPGDKASEVIKAFQQLQAAVREDVRDGAEGGTKSPAAIASRPARTITPPTLDSAAIDAMLEKGLTTAKTAAAPPTTDEEFARRVSLDVTGKLPTPEQVRAFVHRKGKGKRAALIADLLKSPDYATNWARYWRDVVSYHATNQNMKQVGYPALESWLAEQFAANRPWDAVATDLITSSGRSDENGAVNFALAYEAKPVEMAGEVSRIFLGVQIQCAQCHDHKTDPWKREQFHELASFFAGDRARRVNKAVKGEPAVFGVVRQGKARYTMPDLKDPQKQIPVSPGFFLAEGGDPVPAGLTAAQNHDLVASYITGQDNPWFAKAFVNRIWAVLIGEGFTNPIDDMGPGREVHSPEVLEALASQWQQGGYDVQWLFRTILNTKAYQRQARAINTASGRTPFAANCSSQLRSDQILEALSQALDFSFDGPANPRRANKVVKVSKANATEVKTAKPVANKGYQLRNPRAQFNTIFGFDPSLSNDDILGTIPQSLFLMNNPQVDRAIRAGQGTMLGELLVSQPDNRAALETLYLRVLARRPNAREVKTCGHYLAQVGDRGEAFEDILWGLINSTEFVSRR